MKTPEEWFYGVLALLGIVIPWSFNIAWMRTSPSPTAVQFVVDGMANPASSSLTVDIGIVFVVFCVFVVAEARRLHMKWMWVLIPYGAMVALASAFPLFLLLRSRHLRLSLATVSGPQSVA
jgi:hypothetical protein